MKAVTLVDIKCGTCGTTGGIKYLGNEGDLIMLQCKACGSRYLLTERQGEKLYRAWPALSTPSLRHNPLRKQRGKLLTLATVTAERLCSLPTQKMIRENLYNIFRLSDERFADLNDGEDFASDYEHLWYNLASQFQADMETAATERDLPEVARIIQALRRYEKLYFDKNIVVEFEEPVQKKGLRYGY